MRTTLYLYKQFLDECFTNNDCPSTKECRKNECQDPCQYISCGNQAHCKAEDHFGNCFCPPGMQGNPLVNCIDVGCKLNEDCRGNERCNRIDGKCIDLCIGKPCVQGAYCEAENHREICTCAPPLNGDGHVYCTECK